MENFLRARLDVEVSPTFVLDFSILGEDGEYLGGHFRDGRTFLGDKELVRELWGAFLERFFVKDGEVYTGVVGTRECPRDLRDDMSWTIWGKVRKDDLPLILEKLRGFNQEPGHYPARFAAWLQKQGRDFEAVRLYADRLGCLEVIGRAREDLFPALLSNSFMEVAIDEVASMAHCGNEKTRKACKEHILAKALESIGLFVPRYEISEILTRFPDMGIERSMEILSDRLAAEEAKTLAAKRMEEARAYRPKGKGAFGSIEYGVHVHEAKIALAYELLA
jgi:hypothetical protein